MNEGKTTSAFCGTVSEYEKIKKEIVSLQKDLMTHKNSGVDIADFSNSAEHPRWISVEEELPEENTFVTTCNDSGNINLLMRAGNGKWYDKAVSNHRGITHWMPLPSPPHLGGCSGFPNNQSEKPTSSEEGGSQ